MITFVRSSISLCTDASSPRYKIVKGDRLPTFSWRKGHLYTGWVRFKAGADYLAAPWRVESLFCWSSLRKVRKTEPILLVQWTPNSILKHDVGFVFDLKSQVCWLEMERSACILGNLNQDLSNRGKDICHYRKTCIIIHGRKPQLLRPIRCQSPHVYTGWIALCTRLITIERIRIRETNCTIHWIEIYPVNSAIQPLNSRGLVYEVRSEPIGSSRSLVFAIWNLHLLILLVVRKTLKKMFLTRLLV